MTERYRLAVRVGDGLLATTHRFEGREAWALRHLLDAGERGVSSLDHIGPRLSHYVMKLRRAGLVIETVTERHRGDFEGWHARYVLRSHVEVLAATDDRRAA